MWLRADRPADGELRKELVTAALEAGIEDIIIRKEDETFPSLGRFRAWVRDGEMLRGPEGEGLILEISNPQEQERAMELASETEIMVVSTPDWRIIPLENLVAAFQEGDGTLLACAETPEDARSALDALEKGVDGVVIDVGDPSLVVGFAIEDASVSEDLVTAEVIEMRSLGMGDRVCVDSCSIMEPGEGMLIGSQSGCLFLVQSESESSGYVASRPFRVNAGAVHAYILTPDGKTRYLSELSSGDPLLIVDSQGRSREAIVGRCKVEKRPLVLLRAKAGEQEFSTILQNAETVRLCGPEGSISVSDLKPGDKVLVRAEEGGRHFGMSVQESIQER